MRIFRSFQDLLTINFAKIRIYIYQSIKFLRNEKVISEDFRYDEWRIKKKSVKASGVNRFLFALSLFGQFKKEEYMEAKKDGDMSESMSHWKVKKQDISEAFMWSDGYHRMFKKKFSLFDETPVQMKMSDFLSSYFWVFSDCETEEDRLRAYLDGGTFLFKDTAECEKFGMHPFTRSLGEIFDDMVNRKVEEEVRRRLTEITYRNKQKEIDGLFK